ncbi:MAG TPA: hypothetical protein VH020_14970 [Stellaceae bacterium]|nr:hypothetical protein [Stellaceae bacterium]
MKREIPRSANLRKAAWALVVVLALGAAANGAIAGKIQHFKVPGASQIYPMAINSSGTVVGLCYGRGCRQGGDDEVFIRTDDGAITTFSIAGAPSIGASGINDGGFIVGDFSYSADLNHGYLRNTDGTYVQIDAPQSVSTQPVGINDSGVIVGSYAVQNGSQYNWHGFIRATDGTITTFDPPGAEQSWPSGINSSGVISGSYDNGKTKTRGYLRAQDGTYTTFVIKEGATGIYNMLPVNDRGEVAGTLENDSGYYGFLRTVDGKIRTIEVEGATDTFVSGINDRGELVGDYVYYLGPYVEEAGFLRTREGAFKSLYAKNRDYYAYYTEPTCVNGHGAIAGYFGSFEKRSYQGFIRTSGFHKAPRKSARNTG